MSNSSGFDIQCRDIIDALLRYSTASGRSWFLKKILDMSSKRLRAFLANDDNILVSISNDRLFPSKFFLSGACNLLRDHFGLVMLYGDTLRNTSRDVMADCFIYPDGSCDVYHSLFYNMYKRASYSAQVAFKNYAFNTQRGEFFYNFGGVCDAQL